MLGPNHVVCPVPRDPDTALQSEPRCSTSIIALREEVDAGVDAASRAVTAVLYLTRTFADNSQVFNVIELLAMPWYFPAAPTGMIITGPNTWRSSPVCHPCTCSTLSACTKLSAAPIQSCAIDLGDYHCL